MRRAGLKVVLVGLTVVCLAGLAVPSKAPGQTFTPDQTQDFVIRLYDVILQRPVDAPGLADNVSLAITMGDDFVRALTEGFMLSPEFAAGFGSGPSSFVLTLYLSILNRVPTLGEVDFMAAALDMDRGSMITGFFDSPEYSLVVSPTINTSLFLDARPFTLTPGEHAAYLTRLYHIMLQRDPDPVGFQHNLDLLKAGGREFIDELVAAFLMSAEFETLTSSSPQDPNKVVAALYLVLLNRQADSTGLPHYVGQLQTGEKTMAQLVHDFMWSDEGRAILQQISECLFLMNRPADASQGFPTMYTAVDLLLSMLPGILTISEQEAWLLLEQCAVSLPHVSAVVSPISP